MKKYIIRFGALFLAGGILLTSTGCASVEKAYAQNNVSSAVPASLASSVATSSKIVGKHNPYQITFRPLLWLAQDSSQDAASDATVSSITLQKNSSSKKLKINLPWQVYEVCNRLKDCVLTYNVSQTKTPDAPCLQLSYDSLATPGGRESDVADYYTWSQHEFTYKSHSNNVNPMNDENHMNWPLGVYNSPEADKIIAEEYDKLSKQPGASAYAPKKITFGEIFSKSNWEIEKVVVQKFKRGSVVNAGEDNGMRPLTKTADIDALLQKLHNCSLTRTDRGDDTDYHYALAFKVKDGWFSWDDTACTTNLGLKLQEGLPVGWYASPQAQKVIDGYYTK